MMGTLNKTGSFQEDNIVAMHIRIYKPSKEKEFLTVKRRLLFKLPSIAFSLISSFPSQLYFHTSKQYFSSYITYYEFCIHDRHNLNVH